MEVTSLGVIKIRYNHQYFQHQYSIIYTVVVNNWSKSRDLGA